jgi:hypothetical protein
MELGVCKRPCTEGGEAHPVVNVLGGSVRICRDLRMHKARGIVMNGGWLDPTPPDF